MRGMNPAMNEATFSEFAYQQAASRTMTVQGVVNRTGFLLLLLLMAATFTWSRTLEVVEGKVIVCNAGGWIIGGALVGFVIALIIIFVKRTAPILSPVYAICEGLFLGGISGDLGSQREELRSQTTPSVSFPSLSLEFLEQPRVASG